MPYNGSEDLSKIKHVANVDRVSSNGLATKLDASQDESSSRETSFKSADSSSLPLLSEEKPTPTLLVGERYPETKTFACSIRRNYLIGQTQMSDTR